MLVRAIHFTCFSISTSHKHSSIKNSTQWEITSHHAYSKKLLHIEILGPPVLAAETLDLKVVLLLDQRKRIIHCWLSVNVDTCTNTNTLPVLLEIPWMFYNCLLVLLKFLQAVNTKEPGSSKKRPQIHCGGPGLRQGHNKLWRLQQLCYFSCTCAGNILWPSGKSDPTRFENDFNHKAKRTSPEDYVLTNATSHLCVERTHAEDAGLWRCIALNTCRKAVWCWEV